MVVQNVGGGTYSSYTFALDAANNTVNYRINWSSYPSSAIQVHLVARRNNSGGGSDIIGYTFAGLDVSDACPSIPAPPAVENAEAYTQHLYVSRYQTVSNLARLNFYSGSNGTTTETEGGYEVLKFPVTTPSNAAAQVNSTNGALLDVSDKNYMHVDIYVPDNDSTSAQYITFGTLENSYFYPDQQITLGEWNSFDIPLSVWGNSIDWSNVRGGGENCYNASLALVVGNNSQPAVPYTIYVDNWYYYKKAAINGLSATTTYNSATLSWSPLNYNVNPSVYTVQYSTDSGANWTTASTTATSPYVVSGLLSGADYTFMVTGTSSGQTASAEVEGTTNLPLPPVHTYYPDDIKSARSSQYGRNIANARVYTTYCNVTDTVSYAIDGSHSVLKNTLGGLTYGNADGGGNNGANRGIMWYMNGLGADFWNYSTMHIDIFIPDNAVTRTFTGIRFAPKEGVTGTNQVEVNTITLNAWNSFDIPINSLLDRERSTVNRISIAPMVGSGYPESPYVLYVDNFLFHNEDEECVVPRELIDVSDVSNIDGAGAKLYFDGYGTTYAKSISDYTVTARSTAGALTPAVNDAAADYLYVTLGRAPGSSDLTEIVLTHKDGAKARIKFKGTDFVSCRSVCDTIPDSPEPLHNEASVKQLYVSRYETVSHLANLNYYSGSVGRIADTKSGLEVMRFDVYSASNHSVMVRSTDGSLADISAYDYMHVDVYFPDNGSIDARYLRVGLNEGDSHFTYAAKEIELGKWNSFDIPLSALNVADFSNMGGGNFRAELDPVKNTGNTQPTVPYRIYADNWYFYSSGCSESTPSEPAPDPVDSEAAVVSLFSDSYDIGVASLTTNNGELFGFAGTAELVQIDGNNAYKYDDLSHLGFQVPAVDITNLHGFCFDIWAEKPMVISVRAGRNNLGQNFGSYDLTCGWNHVECTFTAAQKTAMSNQIAQIAIDIPMANRTMSILADTYIDNFYLFQTPLVVPLTKRLAAQRVCHVQTDANIRRIQVYSNDGATKYIDQSFATPVGACDLDIRELAVGTYKVLIYDTEGRIADVKVVTAVY